MESCLFFEGVCLESQPPRKVALFFSFRVGILKGYWVFGWPTVVDFPTREPIGKVCFFDLLSFQALLCDSQCPGKGLPTSEPRVFT